MAVVRVAHVKHVTTPVKMAAVLVMAMLVTNAEVLVTHAMTPVMTTLVAHVTHMTTVEVLVKMHVTTMHVTILLTMVLVTTRTEEG